MAHGSNEQYPSWLSVKRQSNTANPGKGFDELHHQDFISVAGRVSCRKIKGLIVHPYQQALLHQGINQCDQEEGGSPDLITGMEYTRAVGTMLMDELADVNESIWDCLEYTHDWAQEALADTSDLDERMEAMKERVQELEERVVQMEEEWHVLCWEVQLSKAVSIECDLQMAELMTEVWEFRLFQATLQHGPGNPIMVEDNEEVMETEEEESDYNGDQVVFPDVGRFSPVPGILVPIMDEDLRDAVLEVERMEEREELRWHHLTMDDQAWREAMEMEQLSRIDPVPGYHAAPGYDMPSHLDPNSDWIVLPIVRATHTLSS